VLIQCKFGFTAQSPVAMRVFEGLALEIFALPGLIYTAAQTRNFAFRTSLHFPLQSGWEVEEAKRQCDPIQ